jgi:hypothetical protein
LDRPLGIYASSLSRRDLHRRRARYRRSSLGARLGNGVAFLLLLAIAAAVVQRLA